ncbi:MAG: HlyD family efflux transporter periplasmic adaptor subunit [Balneolales bacterium]|nr:HlyD family efflux transporter periplasmic adaptor subunit [Balneolales bacterium]
MKRNTIIIITGLLLAIIASGFLLMRDTEKAQESLPPLDELQLKAYQVKTVIPVDVPIRFEYTGRVLANATVQVQPEVQGRLVAEDFNFKEGLSFQKGEILFRIESREFEYQLSAQKSRFAATISRIMGDIKIDYPSQYSIWEEYLDSIEFEAELPPLPEIHSQQLNYFLISNSIFELYYSIKAREERLDYYTIRASFEGYVNESRIEPGSYVSPQAVVGSISNSAFYEIETAVPVRDLPYLNIGDEVQLYNEETGIQTSGTISRIGESLSRASQSVNVFVKSYSEELKEGMFLEVRTHAYTIPNSITIPTKLITRVNQIYVVEEGRARLVPVNPVRFLDDEAIVEGLVEGVTIINEKVTKPIHGQTIDIEVKQ